MGLLSSIGDIFLPAGPHNGRTDPANIFGSPKRVLLGTAPSTNTQQLDLLDPNQKQVLDQLLNYLSGSFGQVGPTPGEATSLEALEQQVLGAVGGQGPVGAAGTALEGLLGRGPTSIEDFYSTNIRDPLLKDFQDIILPDIGKRFAGQFFSGERQDAERQATDDLLSTLTRERARVALEGRRQDDQTTVQAAQGAVAQGTAVSALLESLLGAQGLPRDIVQQQIDNILAALGLQTKENVVTVNPGQQGLLSGFLSGGGGGAIGGALAGLFSSEEFKIDKHEAEEVLDKIAGLRVERWKYKDIFNDPDEHIGPYAEEFHEAFGTPDDKTIPIIDAVGVALKGIQELNSKVTAIQEAFS